jgi:hypothetical protein
MILLNDALRVPIYDFMILSKFPLLPLNRLEQWNKTFKYLIPLIKVRSNALKNWNGHWNSWNRVWNVTAQKRKIGALRPPKWSLASLAKPKKKC